MNLENLKGLYIAHRGIREKDMIENTIPAFLLAMKRGIPIELDVHMLKDGNLVVYHDANLKRLMKINREIENYRYEELKELVFPNTNLHIPLLKDVLSCIGDKVLLIIEIKQCKNSSYVKYCQNIVSTLKQYPYDFVIQSFDIRIVAWFLKNTSYITGLLIANRKHSFYDYMMRSSIILSLLKPHFISVDYHIVSLPSVQKFRKSGPVLVWTIDNPEKLEMVKKWADSFLIENFYF